MIKSLYDFSVRYPSWYTQKEELVNSVKEHREILEAFRKRDEQQVVELIRTHTTDSYYHVLKRMEEQKYMINITNPGCQWRSGFCCMIMIKDLHSTVLSKGQTTRLSLNSF